MYFPTIDGLELLECLGAGTGGIVYRAMNLETQSEVAVKVFDPLCINRELLVMASEAMEEMPPHPGILKPLAYQFDQEPSYCVMPLLGCVNHTPVEGESGDTVNDQKRWRVPTLEDLIQTVRAEEVWKYIYEICDAMAWMHKHNLVHCNLRPSNVLVSEEGASSMVLSDMVQGWVGGLQNFAQKDHCFYLSPEQMQNPEALLSQALRWDVYSFGVLAYRLITGKFPRGMSLVPQTKNGKIPDPETLGKIDPVEILNTICDETEVHWPDEFSVAWNARRCQIIEKCLALDPMLRWADLREVMREFECLEADYLLEDARQKIESEKRERQRKVKLYKVASLVLGAGLVFGAGYAGYVRYLADQEKSQSIQSLSALEDEVEERESEIDQLSSKLNEVREAHREASASLRSSHDAVDQFLSQILQLPTGLGLQATISESEINNGLAFYDKAREHLLKDSNLGYALSRNYFNTAQLLLRKGNSDAAIDHFLKAKDLLEKLLQTTKEEAKQNEIAILLGRTNRWLGTLKLEQSAPSEAHQFFKNAVTQLVPMQAKDPTNRNLRNATAYALYELGRLARRNVLDIASLDGLQKAQELLTKEAMGSELTDQEKFLAAKSRIEQSLVLKEQGKTDDAMRMLFDAMETMVVLVEQSAPRHPERALALAEAYLEFGELVAGKLGSNDAMDAQKQANILLTELITTQPKWVDACLLLARNYGDMAALERDLGNGSEAIRRQSLAVKVMEDLREESLKHPRILLEYTRQLAQHGQLLVDLKKVKEGLALKLHAIQKLKDAFDQEGKTYDQIDRRDALIQLGQFYANVASVHAILKSKDEQKAALDASAEIWKALQEDYGQMNLVIQGKAWVEDQLKKLK